MEAKKHFIQKLHINPIIPLQNQYSFLKNTTPQKDPLTSFSNDLLFPPQLSLPSIKRKKEVSSLRKLEFKIERIKDLLQEKLEKDRQDRQYFSDNRRFSPSLPPYPQPPQIIQMPIPIPLEHYYPQKKARKNRRKKQKSKEPKEKIQRHSQPIKPIEKKDQVEEGKKMIKIKKKNPLNRFRICAYAVYFCVFLRFYSKAFTKNRQKWFNQRYATNDGKILFEQSEDILKKLYEIDLYHLWKDSTRKHTQSSATQLEIQTEGKTLKTSTKIINFSKKFLNKVEEIMIDQKFIDDYHEVFSVGTLNQNYLITNLYLPEQIPFIRIHPEKGYLTINQETQVTLLMIRVMIKMIIFNYLINLKRNKGWRTRQEKLYELNSKELQDFLNGIKQISNYLYIVCEDMYLTALENNKINSNFYEYAHKFRIKPAKNLEDVTKGEQKQRSILIKNLSGYSQTRKLVKKNLKLKNFQYQAKNRVLLLMEKIYRSIKYEERQTYNYLHKMTIDVPYIIRNGIGGTDKKKNILKTKAKERDNKSLLLNEKTSKSFYDHSNLTEQKNRLKGNQSKLSLLNDKKRKNSVRFDETLLQENEDYENGSFQSDHVDESFDDENKENRDKRKYRHEQLIKDSKYPNHDKLTELKEKTKARKEKKLI